MTEEQTELRGRLEWFAIRTRQDFRAEETLKGVCDAVFFPKIKSTLPGGKPRLKAAIPHVLFIRTSREHALRLEQEGRKHPEQSVPFWIYRYPNDRRIQVISPAHINLLRLLTTDAPEGCEVYQRNEFRAHQRVRITGGLYSGYEGFVQRVKKNKHVIVRISGVCLVMLPYIHPDLLEPLD